MIPSWWTPERIALLKAEAETWIGTPFAPNSCAKGRGVSCQMLAGALYHAAGFRRLDILEVPINHARFSRVSLVERAMDSIPDFRRVSDLMEPGDVLGFSIGGCVHHMGIALTPETFAHSIDGLGAVFSSIDDPTWRDRIAVIWRPYP
jgi:cell wall-associated NlpC family hydrolase